MINIEQGNLIELLETDEIDFLIHQTNCFQTIGKRSASGIAKAIGEKYEPVVQADLSYDEGDINQLGKYIVIPVLTESGKQKYIVNLYSQYFQNLKYCFHLYLSEFITIFKIFIFYRFYCIKIKFHNIRNHL